MKFHACFANPTSRCFRLCWIYQFFLASSFQFHSSDLGFRSSNHDAEDEQSVLSRISTGSQTQEVQADGETSAKEILHGSDNGTLFSTSGSILFPRNVSALQMYATRRSKPMLWWHVHKAAGSYMCGAARVNEQVVSPEGNCNWKSHDMYFDAGSALEEEVSCTTRAHYFADQGATWGSVERDMKPGDICPQFAYGTILREPFSLIRSTHAFENQFMSTRKDGPHSQDIRSMPEVITQLRAKILTHSKEVPAYLRFFDNFQVRYFGDAWNVPLGHINVQHLVLAGKRLNNFEVLGTVEKLDSNELFDALGWPRRSISQVVGRANSGDAIFHEEIPGSAFDFLRKLNQYDFQLYEFVKNHK